MQERLKPGTIISLLVLWWWLLVTYGTITNRIDTLESNQLTKEDVRWLLKENNTELLSIIDDKIAIAIQKKKND